MTRSRRNRRTFHQNLYARRQWRRQAILGSLIIAGSLLLLAAYVGGAAYLDHIHGLI